MPLTRLKVNVRLRKEIHDVSRTVIESILPLEVHLPPDGGAGWWSDETLKELVTLVGLNASELLQSPEPGASRKRKRGAEMELIQGESIQFAFELHDTRPRCMLLTFGDEKANRCRPQQVLPVTLSVWPLPFDKDHPQRGGDHIGRITSYFGQGGEGSRAGSARQRQPKDKKGRSGNKRSSEVSEKEQEDINLAIALSMSCQGSGTAESAIMVE